MLHDPKWDKGTLAGLIHWLEGQDPSTRYNWSNGCDCLIARYEKDVGLTERTREMQAIYGGTDKFMIGRSPEAYGINHHTYGAALQRAYAAREEALAA